MATNKKSLLDAPLPGASQAELTNFAASAPMPPVQTAELPPSAPSLSQASWQDTQGNPLGNLQPQEAPAPVPQQPTAPVQSYDTTPQVLGLNYVPGTTPKLTEGDNRILESQGRQAQFARDALDATTKANDEAQQVYRQAVDDDEQRIAAIERVQADSDREHSRSLTEIDDKIKNLPPVTPKTFGELWANTDTGGKILAGIGLALSVLGKAGTTASIIDGAIERDVRKQQALYENSKENVGLMRQALGDRKKLYDDRLDNMDKLRIISWEKYKRLLQGYEAKVQGEEQKAKLGSLVETAIQQQELARQQMWQRAQKRAAGRIEAVLQVNNQRMGMPVEKAYKLQGMVQKQNIDQGELDLKRQKMQQETEAASKLPKIPGLKPTGEEATPPGPGELKQIREDAGAIKVIFSEIAKLQKLAKKGTVWNDEDRAQATVSQQIIGDKYRMLAHMGVPQEHEIARINQIVPNPVQITEMFAPAKLKALRGTIMSSFAGQVAPYGYAPVEAPSSAVQPLMDTKNLSFRNK